MNIKNREKLLQDIADELASSRLTHTRYGCLEVVFRKGNKEIKDLEVHTALNYLVNDVYFDAEADWSKADNAIVRSI